MTPKAIAVVIVFVIVALVAFALYRQGLQNVSSRTAEREREVGRIITPDTDWEPAGGRNAEQPASTNTTEPATGNNQPGAGTTSGRIEPGTMTIAMNIDGQEHPLDEPIYAFEGQQFNVEFRLTATGQELASYVIENPAAVLKTEGELSGFQATVPYSFTYVSQLWQNGGIVISVINKAGSAEFRQIMVLPRETPLRPPR